MKILWICNKKPIESTLDQGEHHNHGNIFNGISLQDVTGECLSRADDEDYLLFIPDLDKEMVHYIL